jgi:hypothetical protein
VHYQAVEIIMLRFRSFARNLGAMLYTLMAVLLDVVRLLMLYLRPACALAAENPFLRKQLAQYQERHVKPRRANDATRIALVWLSQFFDWRRALVMVQPATLIRWHRQGFRWFWRWRSIVGRPVLPKDLQTLIRRMALENPTWGQERIANELLLKLGLKSRPTLCANTCRITAWVARVNAVSLNAGPPFFVITPRASSHVTSA